MPVSNADISILPIGRLQGGPLNPFEQDVAKQALQEALDKGEVTQKDVDLLKQATTWIPLCSSIGGLSGVPLYIMLRSGPRKRPMLWSLAASTMASFCGSFLGFIAGGMGVTMSINNNMDDAHEKLRTFQDIAETARDGIIQVRETGTVPTWYHPRAIGVPSGMSSKTLPDGWAGSDSGSASTSSAASSSPSSASSSSSPDFTAGSSQTEALLRQNALDKEERQEQQDLAKAQAEFDAMVERERKGGDDLDTYK